MEGARAVRELGQALASRPFQLALALSVVFHVVFLAAFRGGAADQGRKSLPPMRVRLIRTSAAPVGPPAPAVPPSPAREEPAKPSRGPSAVPAPAPARNEGSVSVAPAVTAARTAEAPAAIEPQPVPDAPAPLIETAAAGAVPGAGPVAVVVTEPPEDGGGGEAEVPAAGGWNGPDPAAAPAAADSVQAGIPAPAPVAAAAPPGASGSGEKMTPTAGAPSGLLTDLRRRIDSRKVYPQLAVRNGWEGKVLVEVLLEDGGRLAELRLVQGSGYALLDDATLATVRRAAPFPPLEGRVTVPVEYRLTP